eukprot:jgi/Chlat1/1926/Chrsp153S08700
MAGGMGGDDHAAAQNGTTAMVDDGDGDGDAHKRKHDFTTASRAVDLRSDTVTKPTDEMREAMATAVVDDDVLGEDPTAVALQEYAAQLFGKEAGLFVPSGTMGNLISLMVHCEQRGSEAIMGSESHIHYYEQGGCATIAGIHPRVIANNLDGTMDLSAIQAAIRALDDHFPITRVIAIENTHNRCGGRCLSVEYTDAVGALAKRYGLPLHIDGARIMNAAQALGVTPARLTAAADSVSVCLSKGLAAPVGSIIVGSREFIRKARRCRKVLGGGMRQVGVIAAAGLVSLQRMPALLQLDHRHAKLLAEGMATVPGIVVDPNTVETNIIYAALTASHGLDSIALCAYLKQRGVLILPFDKYRIRLVTHYHITKDDVRYAVNCFSDAYNSSEARAALGSSSDLNLFSTEEELEPKRQKP